MRWTSWAVATARMSAPWARIAFSAVATGLFVQIERSPGALRASSVFRSATTRGRSGPIPGNAKAVSTTRMGISTFPPRKKMVSPVVCGSDPPATSTGRGSDARPGCSSLRISGSEVEAKLESQNAARANV